jgi:trimeric autotransporter adhesin
MRGLRAFGCLLVLFWAGPSSLFGQTFTGAIRGEVRDAAGVIPTVTVTLTNDATQVARETATNDLGQYQFPAVSPATYTVRTALAGYKAVERSGLRVGTQQILTIDLMLEPGAIQETVTVTGEPLLVDLSTASIGGTLDRQQLAFLPAPGRNPFLIGITVPTVNPVGDHQFNRQQDQDNASLVSLGGGGIRANNYLIDGVPITDLSGRAVLNPTIEALEDVKVQVRTYDAESGRTGGGVFNVTARSGANKYDGSAFFQTRPVWGQSENFFNQVAGLTKEETGLANAYYRLYGGGVGGPIHRSRTFFWAAAEGYRSATTRNLQEIWPGLKQRNGDFSDTTAGGRPVQLYNPWCRGGVVNPRCPAAGTGSIATRGLFTNAVIPLSHPAVSPVALNIVKEWPTATINGPIRANEDGEPNAIDTALVVDKAFMWTFKGAHKFTDDWSLSGLYIYDHTVEPGATIMSPDKWYIADAREFFGPLHRRPEVLTFNNTTVLDNTTVLALRYGWSTFEDSYDAQPYGPGLQALGFSPVYVNALSPGGRTTLPSLQFDEVQNVGGWGGAPARWRSPYAISGTLTTLWGTHSLKVGGDLRRLEVAITTQSLLGGAFQFNRLFTSDDGAGGHELASFLLGLPASGSAPANAGEGEWFTRYYGGYVQDDWRVSSRFTLNYGIRFEHEDGLRAIGNRQSVAFDRNAINPIDPLVPKAGTLLEGQTLRGGLIYAGVNGAPEQQGDSPRVKPAPRIGATYLLDPNTVVRGGYGVFWAPWNYTIIQPIGFSRSTELVQSSSESDAPLTVLDNPFPSGLLPPVGSSLGLLTGVGGTIDFVDQTKGAPKVHQYSVDLQRELPGRMTLTVGYIGATGRDIGFGGAYDAAININQIDPAVAQRLFPAAGGGWDAAALREAVPNPFFGVAQAGELGTRDTIPRGQLLRPFPQFGDVLMHETTNGGKRQYHAVTFTLDKRLTGSWGGRYSYTWSRTMDNQFGAGSAYQTATGVPQNNYDLEAEYAVSNFDSPHRIILAPIVRLPSPANRKSLAHVLGAGWNASAIVELVSGSPLSAVLSDGVSDANLGLLGGRQRPDLIGSPSTSGSDPDRVSSADHPDGRWFDAGAFADPGPGAYGNAPRAIGDARYQFRRNVDVVFTKQVQLSGGQLGEIRFEILNATNTPKFRGIDSNAIDVSSFGRITAQAGFMRIWQLSFRYRFL